MKRFSAFVLASMVGSLVTIGSYELINDEPNEVKIEHVDKTPVVSAAYTVNEAGEYVPLDFTEAADKVMPAVVHIRSTQVGNYASRDEQVPQQFRDFFGPFFRDDRPYRQGPRVGSGSGVLINSDGYIVTNNHVIDGADELDVTLNDNRSFKATVVGTDPTTDLAVIKIAEKDLPHLELVDSDRVRVGEWVLAVGNPFNLNSTVTAGIVSAKGRSINIINSSNPGNPGDSVNTAIESFIQTDAAVNPGNSGGALVNLSGDLIGINTAIASPTGAYSGYAFAVPANIVTRVVEDLVTYGTVQRGWLGVQINSITSDFAKQNDLTVNAGAYISGISPKSGALEAGIKEGDVVTRIDNIEVNNTAQLIGYIGSKRPGDVVKVFVNRDGKEMNFDVTLKNRNGSTDIIEKEPETVFSALGADLENVDAKTLKRLDIKSGVRVKNIGQGKIRKHTDMREGFIITKIDGKPVKSKEDVIDILETKKGGVLLEGVYENQPGSYYYGLGL